MRIFIFLLGIICLPFLSFNLQAQKNFKSKGTAQVKMEDNISKDATMAKAKELAIINAIEEVLGTYIEQETNIGLEDGEFSFKVRGNTKVKGDWLKTTKEEYKEDPVVIKNPNGKGNITEIWVTCKIEGIVREIVKPKLAFNIVPLNCPQTVCRTTTFYNGEQFYLSFESPSSGYMSVYIVESDVVYRLLPYSEMDENYSDAIQVVADKNYIFFSQDPEHDYFTDFPYSRVDEIEMTTELDKEYLTLYIVFSTEQFSKPILHDGVVMQKGSLPKSLTSKQFEEWITLNRIYNASFNYEVLNLEIVKK